MIRKQLRDTMDKHDAYTSGIGQAEAKRYLRTKEQATPPGRGNLRAALAFLLFTATLLLI